MYPFLTYLEEGRKEFVLQKVKPNLPTHVGPVFEDVCRSFRVHSGKHRRRWTRVGAWWDKTSAIDVVATSDAGEILFGECKWSERKVGTNVYRELKSKGKALTGQFSHASYVLFSKKGFTPDMKQVAKDDHVELIELKDMID